MIATLCLILSCTLGFILGACWNARPNKVYLLMSVDKPIRVFYNEDSVKNYISCLNQNEASNAYRHFHYITVSVEQ